MVSRWSLPFKCRTALLFLLVFFLAVNLNAEDEHVRLGNIYLASNEIDLAIQEYSLALTGGIEDAELYNNIGYSYFLKKKFDEAQEYYLKAINADMNFAVPYNNQGVVFHRRKNYPKAIEYYQSALKLQPNYTKAAYNLAVVYYRQGSYLKAARQYLRAKKINKAYGEKRFQNERMVKSVKEELKKDPDNKNLQRALKHLEE